MKVSGADYLIRKGVENIGKNKMMAFATFCVLLISLLLVGMAALFYINMDSMIVGLGNQNEIAVYLNTNTSKERVQGFGEELKEMDNVYTVDYVSKEQALARMRSQITKGNVIFGYIDGYDFMPDGFKVTVIDTERIESTASQIAQLADVQSASASPQVAQFLRELRQVVTVIASAIIIALSVVSLIMISNTTKASVFARREEIQIMKYVGASNTFIRTPFFIEGMVTGFIAGVGAFFISYALYDAIFKVISEQNTLMRAFGVGSIIPFENVRLILLFSYIFAGALMGAVGSVISTSRHLNV